MTLFPCIELALTSCAQSSNVSAGISDIDFPTGSLRYTCADDKSSTWNLRNKKLLFRFWILKGCASLWKLLQNTGQSFLLTIQDMMLQRSWTVNSETKSLIYFWFGRQVMTARQNTIYCKCSILRLKISKCAHHTHTRHASKSLFDMSSMRFFWRKSLIQRLMVLFLFSTELWCPLKKMIIRQKNMPVRNLLFVKS